MSENLLYFRIYVDFVRVKLLEVFLSVKEFGAASLSGAFPVVEIHESSVAAEAADKMGCIIWLSSI